MTKGSAEFFLSGDQLVKGSQVLAHDCQTILEVARNPEQCEVNELFELRAGGANLFVTSDHRVPVLRANAQQSGERSCDLQAKDLQPGDRVFVNGSPASLTSANKLVLPQTQRVLKIVFQPNMPVAVFGGDPATSTKGDATKRIPRGGMNKREKPGKVSFDCI